MVEAISLYQKGSKMKETKPGDQIYTDEQRGGMIKLINWCKWQMLETAASMYSEWDGFSDGAGVPSSVEEFIDCASDHFKYNHESDNSGWSDEFCPFCHLVDDDESIPDPMETGTDCVDERWLGEAAEYCGLKMK